MFKRALVRTGITVNVDPVAWVGSDPRRLFSNIFSLGLAVMPLATERRRWIWCQSFFVSLHPHYLWIYVFIIVLVSFNCILKSATFLHWWQVQLLRNHSQFCQGWSNMGRLSTTGSLINDPMCLLHVHELINYNQRYPQIESRDTSRDHDIFPSFTDHLFIYVRFFMHLCTIHELCI